MSYKKIPNSLCFLLTRTFPSTSMISLVLLLLQTTLEPSTFPILILHSIWASGSDITYLFVSNIILVSRLQLEGEKVEIGFILVEMRGFAPLWVCTVRGYSLKGFPGCFRAWSIILCSIIISLRHICGWTS